MITNSINLNRIKEIQKKLYCFLEDANEVSGNDIRQWISECIVHFTEVGVPSNIVSYFLEKVDYRDIHNGSMYGTSGSHGPFIYNGLSGSYSISQENRLTGKSGGQTKMTPILVAFKVAENLIDRYGDTLRLIPQSLISELDKYNETKTISVSLSLIQLSFEKKDSKNILSALISATDSIFKLIPELSDKKDLGPKIKKAYETTSICEKYSINRELLWSLNNARIIRNIDTHKPDKNNETSMYEAVSYAHLLLLLILSIISSGKINLSET